MTQTLAKSKKSNDGPVTIKKYANRRLYNTASSSYVTLDHLSQMVKDGIEFQVFDAKSGEDITKSVLTQIIFEEESKGQNLLPIDFLRQLIKFYGDSMQAFVPSYLEMSIDAFARNQEQIQARLKDAFSNAPGYKSFEDQIAQNMALFQNTMRMFSPFPHRPGGSETSKATNKSTDESSEINELKAQLSAMQEQLNKLVDND